MIDSLPSVTMGAEGWSCRKGRGEIFAPAISPWFIHGVGRAQRASRAGAQATARVLLKLETCLQLSFLGSRLSFPGSNSEQKDGHVLNALTRPWWWVTFTSS